jgi:O-antigen/teichoic acid export membrane protein
VNSENAQRGSRLRRALKLLPTEFVNVRNLGTSWLSYGMSLLVAFFLSPFIIHSLGDTAYGFWTLLMSVAGYLGLIDLGVRVSTGRYLNYYLGQNDEESAARVVSTSLVLYTALGLLVLGAAVLLGAYFESLFSAIPQALSAEASGVLPVLGVSVWLTLYGSVFGQLMVARERFDVRNLSSIIVLVLRSFATVIVIRRQGGLVGLAAVLAGAAALELLLLYCAVRYLRIPFHFSLRHIARSTLRELAAYSSWSFLINAGSRIINYADAAVIAVFLGLPQVTVFSIGFMLIDYGSNLIAHVVGVMTPEIYKKAGARDLASLRQLAVNGAQSTMFFAVPLLVGFIVFGDAFVRLWMGPGYEASAQVLAILSVSQLALLASRGCGAVLWGLGTVRLLAVMTLLEAITNLGLSILLAVPMGLGIIGIALGTAIPTSVIGMLVLPFHACRRMELPLWQYQRLTAGRWMPAAGLSAVVCTLAKSLFVTSAWTGFAAAVAFSTVAYLPLGWFFLMRGATLPRGPAARPAASTLNADAEWR